MTTNMGALDRLLRLVAGIALIVFALAGPADIAWKWVGWIGAVPLLTSIVGWCPAYTLFGINTCRTG